MEDLKEQPAGLDTTPALTFKEIEQRVMAQLMELDQAQQGGMPLPLVLDQQCTILFGAFRELLKTLEACQIEPKRITVVGSLGHG